MGVDVVISEIYVNTIHTFSEGTYIKNISDKIDKLFENTLKNYG